MFAFLLGLYLYGFVTKLRTVVMLRERMVRLTERWGSRTPPPWEERVSGKLEQE